ncbi:FAD dependent oxidoreductase [Aureobasidium subglaciale]|nr:FAD dependent oxidoreductase [Aureobasidium subglaciale]
MNALWSLFGKGEQVVINVNDDNELGESDGLPVPNHTSSYWRSELHPIDSYCSSEQLPSECDVAIIGAGMTGVSTAYHLSCLHSADEYGRKPSIVILDAREVCSGATGRNGGHSKVQAFTMRKLISNAGVDAANELAAFVSAQKYHMKDAVDREELDCEFEMRRSYDVYVKEEEAREAEQLYRAAVKEGHAWVRDLDFVGPRFAEQVTSIQGAKAAISMPACSLWPYKFVSQLLSRLIEARTVKLYTHMPVTSIDLSDASSTTLHTPHGSLRTKKLVFATNAYTPAICPSYKDQITPYKGTACHIAPANPISPHLSHTYNIYHDHPSDQPARVDYLNPRPDSGIVVGGANFLFNADKASWYNNTDDSTLLPNVRQYFSCYMQSTFKGWESSKAKITHLWTGIQGETKDGFPFVGKVPGKEDWYIAAGFNGGGMTFIFSCTEGLAKMVEGKTYKETGLPKMFDAERMGK